MSQIKVQKWYDVACEGCAKHLSTDYGRGSFDTPNEARAAAKAEGFRVVQGQTLCEYCQNHLMRGFLRIDEYDNIVNAN